MKNTLLFVFCFFISIDIFSQANVWMVPIVANNVNLRQPKSTVFDSITINCQTTGKVFVRFDGNCTSSAGDRIILASSDYPDWRTNDGNTSVIINDSLHAITTFDHTRVFPVEAGMHIFYAVGQNYVETHGSGYASISGHFTALFMPDSLPDQALSGIGINDCCWSWQNDTHVFPNTSIEVSTSGKLLVDFESFVAANDGTKVQFGSSMDSLWSGVNFKTPVHAFGDDYFSSCMHQDVIATEPGTQSVYGLVNFIAGDSTSTNNYLYGTLNAQFIPDNNPTNFIKNTRFNDAASDLEVHLLTTLNFTNTVTGKAWLHVTGSTNTDYDDRVRVRILDGSLAGTILGEVILQPSLENSELVNFSLSGLKEVLPGEHTFYLVSVYDSIPIGLALADDLKGMFSVQFIGNPIPSKVADPSFSDSFTLFPNPTRGQFNFQSLSLDNNSPVEVTIINAVGQPVNHQVVTDINQYCDLTTMPDGEYFIQIKQGNRVGVKSLMKSGSQQ